MKRIVLTLITIISSLIAISQNTVAIRDDFGYIKDIYYGEELVYVDVDGKWFCTHLYEYECDICHHKYDCEHRSCSKQKYIINAKDHIGIFSFERPDFPPSSYTTKPLPTYKPGYRLDPIYIINQDTSRNFSFKPYKNCI